MLRERCLFIGDSLIEFFDWQKRFPDKEILNLGLAGETVEGLFKRLISLIDKLPPPDVILIMTGTNNLGMEEYGFLGSYEKIILTFKKSFPEAKIVANSLLPMQLPWLSEQAVPRANIALREMSGKMAVSYLDVFNPFICRMNRTDKTCFLEDGVHLTDYGYEVWSEVIADFLSRPG